MKATRIILTAALVALLALPAMAAVNTALSAVVATGAANSKTDTGNAKYVRVHVYRADDAAASTATILIQQSTDGSKWYTVATVTNPTGMDATTGNGGELWSVASVAYTRLYVSAWTAGQITATIEVAR